MKRKPKTKNVEPRKFVDGETVLIVRPEKLWAGCNGTVVSFANGLHHVHIEAKDGETYPNGFHADVPGSLLEPFI